MRALVDSYPPALYRRFTRRCQVGGLLADTLVDGEPYLALQAILLDESDDTELRWLTDAFARAFHVAGRALSGDVPRLVEMGFPWAAAELLAAEAPRMPVVGRFDFLRGGDGRWYVVELNADTPSGVREGTVGEGVVRALAPGGCDLANPNQGLGSRLIDAFDLAVPLGAGALGIVTSAGAIEDLSQSAYLAELLRPRLTERGVEVVLGDGRNLRATGRGATLCGRPIGALYRLLPFETMLGTPSFASLFEAVLGGHMALLNGLYGLLLQHKGLMAWLWEHRNDPRLDDEARRAIADHLPPTRPVEESSPAEDVVVKQVFGREGEEVFFGHDLSPVDWAELRRRRTYVVQRRVPVEEIDVLVPTAAGAEVWRGHPTVGAFAVDGRWAGYYTRFGRRLTTRRAKWLATLVP